MNPGLKSKSCSKLFMLEETISELVRKSLFVPFVAIAESWLKPFITDTQLCIPCYNIYRSDRKQSKNGGVLIYVHKDIIVDITSCYDDDICSAVICLSKKRNSIIICVYRPPNSAEKSFSDLLNFLNTFINSHNSSNKFQTYIFGDFNLPKISWNNVSSSKHKSVDITNLFNFMDEHLLVQYVSDNTRNSNLLDLFLTDNPNFVNLVQIEDICYSDHRLLKIFNTFFSPLCKDAVPVDNEHVGLDFSALNLSKVNYNNVNRELSEVDWDTVVNAPINDFPSIFQSIVYKVLRKHSRLNKLKHKFISKFDKEIKILNRKIKKLRKKMKFSDCNLNNKTAYLKKIDKFFTDVGEMCKN